jgi:hypothetical protein
MRKRIALLLPLNRQIQEPTTVKFGWCLPDKTISTTFGERTAHRRIRITYVGVIRVSRARSLIVLTSPATIRSYQT